LDNGGCYSIKLVNEKMENMDHGNMEYEKWMEKMYSRSKLK